MGNQITTLGSAKKFLEPKANIGNGIAKEALHICEIHLVNCREDTPINYEELITAAKKRVMGRG